MKKIVTYLSISAAFSVLAISSLIGTYQKKVLRIGDVTPDGAEVVKTGIDMSKVHKYKPLTTPTDTYYNKQKTYSLSNVGDLETTWDYYTGKGVTVAVIDSGFTYGHEDFIRDGKSVFSDKSAYFYTEYDSYWDETGTTYKVNATSDDWECMKHEYDSDYREWDTHGSNVSGCVAAAMNGVGTVGIAPDATILALKIDFYDPSINAAIDYAVECGADIINMSLGAYDSSDPHTSQDSGEGVAESEAESIANAISHGVIVVAAAGNESTAAKSYPACNEGVIGVGALDTNSSTQPAEYTNFNKSTDKKEGNHNVDVMAPGTVWAPGLDESELGNSSSKYPKLGYGETQGTSFASPITAGAAALWKEKHPTGTPAQFEEDLYNSAVNIGSFQQFGNGRLDVYNLLDIDSDLSPITVDKKSIEVNDRDESFTLSASSKAGTIASVVPQDSSICEFVSASSSGGVLTSTFNVKGVGSTSIKVTDSESNYIDVPVTVSEYVEVTGITTSETSGRSVAIGKSFNIGASVVPSNASNKSLTYVSNDTSIATVNSSGLVTGQAEGSTSITITSADGPSITFNVTVTTPTSETYQIVFASAENDGTKEVAGLSSLIESDESEIVKDSSASKVYAGKNGIKMSSSNTNGYASISLAETLDINTVTVSAAKYKDTDSNVTLTINNKTVSLTSISLEDYTFNLLGQSTDELEIDANKRLYIKSITIETGYNFVDVTSVTLNEHELDLNVGETFQLSATVLPANATNKSVSYNTNLSGVATVSETGLVTAVSDGTATIRVITNSGAKIDECVVNVSTPEVPVTGVSLSRTSLEMEVGDAQMVYAHVEPTNATNQEVDWQSSNLDVATVEDGYIEAVGEGTATITVTTVDGNFEASLTVTVSDGGGSETVAVTGVTLSNNSLELEVGDTFQLSAPVSPSNATNKSVTWSTGENLFATVSESGLVTAVNAGTTNVTVTTVDGGFTASCTVTVSDKEVPPLPPVEDKTLESIEIITLPTKLSYTVGESIDLTGMVVYAYFSDDSFEDVSSDVSCDLNTLTQAGTLEATISYTYNQDTKTDSFQILVSESTPEISYILHSLPSKTEYKVGESLDLTGLAIYISINYGDHVDTIAYNGKVTATGFDSSKAGTCRVSLYVEDGTLVGSYEITVKKKGLGCRGDITTTSVVLASISLVGLIGLAASKLIKKKED